MSTSARLEELLKRFDENPRRFFAPLANEYRKSGDLERAIELCQTHLIDQPGNMNGHVVYGQALFEAGRYDESRVTFETALELDPENLIALRHLGDIARSRADTNGARHWYTRVLDADPRNEEIIGFLTELDTIDANSAAAAAAVASQAPTRAVTPPRSSTPAAPLMPTPVIPMDAIVAADQHASVPMDFGLMDMSLDFGTSETVTLADPGEDHLPGVLSTSAEIDELDAATASLDTFAAVAAPLEPFAAAPIVPFTAASHVDIPTDDGFPSFADIGFADDPSPMAAEPASHDFATLSFDPPALTDPLHADPLHADPLHADPLHADPLHADPLHAAPVFRTSTPAFGIDPVVGRVPTFDTDASQVSETPAPFVTETMAELYLTQGFRAEALEVYKQLSAQNPSDESLKDRVRSIEGGGRSSLAFDKVIGEEVNTARGFFAALSGRRPVGGNGSSAITATAPVAAPVVSVPEVAGVLVAPGGTLDTLFNNTAPSLSDEHAAGALSTFAGAVETAAPVVQGRPTQAAATELSLDSVFRDTPMRASANVSRQSQKLRFDQFFSPADEAPSPDSAPIEPPAGEPGTPGELAQFQDWLTQMKKP